MADLPGRIAIAGPPCSGKTAVGEALASLAGYPFTDLDSEIEREAGMSIPSIFGVSGEEGFRRAERSALLSVLGRGGRLVLALGGGTLLDPRNLAAVSGSTTIVTLRVPAGTLLDRVGGPERPLAADREGLSRLLTARSDHYDGLPGGVDCAGLSPEGCAEAIITMLSGGAGS